MLSSSRTTHGNADIVRGWSGYEVEMRFEYRVFAPRVAHPPSLLASEALSRIIDWLKCFTKHLI